MNRLPITNWLPSPETVEELRSLAMAGNDDSQLARHFGVPRTTIEYHRRANRIPNGYVRPNCAAPPAGFHELAPTVTQKACAEHFGVSTTTVRRWYAKTGLEPSLRVYSKAAVDNGASPHARKVWRQSGKAPMALPILRDFTAAGQAQLFLQRFGPVFRASTLKPGATGWIMFNRHVSEEDLIANAHRKGFRSEAMAA